MAVDVQTTPTVAFGEADGKQLLVTVPDRTDPRSREVDVVLHWFEELKRRAPTQ